MNKIKWFFIHKIRIITEPVKGYIAKKKPYWNPNSNMSVFQKVHHAFIGCLPIFIGNKTEYGSIESYELYRCSMCDEEIFYDNYTRDFYRFYDGKKIK